MSADHRHLCPGCQSVHDAPGWERCRAFADHYAGLCDQCARSVRKRPEAEEVRVPVVEVVTRPEPGPDDYTADDIDFETGEIRHPLQRLAEEEVRAEEDRLSGRPVGKARTRRKR